MVGTRAEATGEIIALSIIMTPTVIELAENTSSNTVRRERNLLLYHAGTL